MFFFYTTGMLYISRLHVSKSSRGRKKNTCDIRKSILIFSATCYNFVFEIFLLDFKKAPKKRKYIISEISIKNLKYIWSERLPSWKMPCFFALERKHDPKEVQRQVENIGCDSHKAKSGGQRFPMRRIGRYRLARSKEERRGERRVK